MKAWCLIVAGVLFMTSAVCTSSKQLSGTVENTMSIVQREVEQQLAEIVRALPSSATSPMNLELSVAAHPDRAWVEVQALRAIEPRTDIELADSGAVISLEVVVIDMSTRYEATASTDSVERIVTVAVAGIVRGPGTGQKRLDPPRAEVRTRCLRSEAMAMQSLQLNATHGELPAVQRSTFEEIIEPAIFVAAAVVTVVLAFTVRSK